MKVRNPPIPAGGRWKKSGRNGRTVQTLKVAVFRLADLAMAVRVSLIIQLWQASKTKELARGIWTER
jgi:hypothetical protein